jgi:hypothetical protein
MKLNTSTEALRYLIGATVMEKSKMGDYTSDSHLKKIVEKQYESFPLFFGVNSQGNGPSDLSVIQGSRRSGLTYIRQRQNNQTIGKGVLRYLDELKNLKYIKESYTGEYYYYFDGVLQSAQLAIQNDPNYTSNHRKEIVYRNEDIHTTLQYELTAIAKMCGYNVYIPNCDRNKKIKEGLTILQDFSEVLVNSFNGMNSRSDDIDCIWVDENGNPVKAFEVENSTGVDSGMSRLSSLQEKIPTYIVGTKDSYQKKFIELKETSYKNSKMNFTYIKDTLVSKEFLQLNEHSDAYDIYESRRRIEKKFK